jgi:chromosome partitioning protein
MVAAPAVARLSRWPCQRGGDRLDASWGGWAVRKLLVTSQKGGVGKTTAAVNLATAAAMAGSRTLLVDADPLSTVSTGLNLGQHPQRRPMRGVRKDLPGVMVSEVVHGVDLISPYEEGGCSDESLDSLLRLVQAPAMQECYGCLVVNAPPFMGTNPAQLVASCDELILVMRAEAMAHRTLPAFLELVQRSQAKPHMIRMRGILLTLPEGEQPGGRWERELRGRLGGRVLPQTIPHDEAVTRALLFGQVVAHSNPHSPAAIQYGQLAQTLGLAAEARGSVPAQVSSALAAAASAAPTAPPLERAAPVDGRGPREPAKPGAPPSDTRPRTPLPGSRSRFEPLPPGARKTPLPARAGDNSSAAPGGRPPQRNGLPASAPGSAAAGPPARGAVPARRPVATPAARAAIPTHVYAGPGPTAWVIWFVAAIVAGIGLRFLPQSKQLLPFVVGVGVGSLVVLLLWGLRKPVVTTTRTRAPVSPPRPAANQSGRKSDNVPRVNGHSQPPRRPQGGNGRRK